MGNLFRDMLAAKGAPLAGVAPMAGFTDAPYRLLCAEYGADFAVTEMVSADGLVRDGKKTRSIMKRLPGEAPLGIQLFGAIPAVLAEAAAIAAAEEPAFIDLNFGCPVKKVVRKNGGVAVMRDLCLLEDIVAAVVAAVEIPVTVKIRSGWSSREKNYLEAGEAAADAGAAAVILHPRFRTQGFSGEADPAHLARLREALAVPVIASGDVRSPADFTKTVEETGCRIVLIGRGTYGRPWIFRQIADAIAGRESAPVPPDEAINVLERHLRSAVAWKGERLAVLEMRKLFRWYVRDLRGMRDFRSRLSGTVTLGETLEVIAEMREEIEKEWTNPA
ncbi:MAG: tRNA dihydrouridine synthase DusB [Candidatus Krumholzibacteriota bacterium]|nr:tRNA dihydrouridine synthase DusB [Candidatus Krumholzibacteriota bacterium]